MIDQVPYQVCRQAVLANASYTLLHTVNRGRWFVVENIHLANTTGAAVTVRFCLIPSGGTPGTATALAYDFSIPANDFIEFGAGLRLGPNGTIEAAASAVSAITATVCGVEKTYQGA